MNVMLDEKEILGIETRLANRERLSNDGILDFVLYCNAPLRILWVLKQEVDNGLAAPDEKLGADWKKYYPRGICNDAKASKLIKSKTWGNMAIASHMLLNDCTFEKAKNDGEWQCATSLLATAIIEILKEPGGSRTTFSALKSGFNAYCELLEKQVNAYKPDVVVLCAGEQKVKQIAEIIKDKWLHCGDWNWTQKSKKGNAVCDFAKNEKKGVTFIWTSHPEDPKFFPSPSEEYCSAIREAVYTHGK